MNPEKKLLREFKQIRMNEYCTRMKNNNGMLRREAITKFKQLWDGGHLEAVDSLPVRVDGNPILPLPTSPVKID